ncbi:MAG: LapA family protein [Burkholderiales bacterium]|nr:LapA family protein [Burkholderiales bacterium]
MHYLFWTLKVLLFVLILSFAVKNTDMVTVRYYLGYEWRSPLVLVLLVFFCAGVVVGIAANLAHLFRQRREIVALKREARMRARDEPPAAPPDAA